MARAPLHPHGRGWGVDGRLRRHKAGRRRVYAARYGGFPLCWNHDPACAEERRRNASRAATSKHSKIDREIRDVRLMTKEHVGLTVSDELDLRVKKRLTEIAQLLQVYCRLAELELAAGGGPRFSEPGEYGLPLDTAKGWAEKEGEKAKFMETVSAFNKVPMDTLKRMG